MWKFYLVTLKVRFYTKYAKSYFSNDETTIPVLSFSYVSPLQHCRANLTLE